MKCVTVAFSFNFSGAFRINSTQIKTEIHLQKKVWGCQVCRTCWPRKLPDCEMKWPRNFPSVKSFHVDCFTMLLKPYVSYALCSVWISGKRCLEHCAVSGHLISKFDDISWPAYSPEFDSSRAFFVGCVMYMLLTHAAPKNWKGIADIKGDLLQWVTQNFS